MKISLTVPMKMMKNIRMKDSRDLERLLLPLIIIKLSKLQRMKFPNKKVSLRPSKELISKMERRMKNPETS